MKKLLFVALYSAVTAASAQTVNRDGKVWMQASDSLGLTWDALDSLCPLSSGRACAGGGLDGYTWASNQDVLGLYQSYLTGITPNINVPFASGGSVIYESSTVGQTYSNAVILTDKPLGVAYKQFSNDFTPTLFEVIVPATVFQGDITRSSFLGWTGDLFTSGGFRLGGIASVIGVEDRRSPGCTADPTQGFCSTFSSQDAVHFGVDSTGTLATTSSSARGAWLYQTAAPVPEPETYAMMLAGLGLLGVVARRRKQKEAAV